MKVPWKYLALWLVTLFVLLIVFTFVHEVGHGLGARIDGNHISTGFNRLGMPGKTPDAPDFRAGMPEGIWTGLLGPITTWVLAIAFTAALYTLKKPGTGSFLIGASAVANGMIRAVPATLFLLFAIGGSLHKEDEVGWGMWIVTHFLNPALKGIPQSDVPASQWLSYPAVWIPPFLSLGVSLVCLVLAFRRIFRLEGVRLAHWFARLMMVLLPLLSEVAAFPVLNALDRLIRVNW